MSRTQKVPVIPEITNDVPLASRRALIAMKVTLEYLLTQQGATPSRFQSNAQAGSSGGGSTNHEALQGLLGGGFGDHSHLTTAQEAALTGGASTGLHHHDTDRDLANATGVLPWAQVDTAGVSLADIGSLAHSELTGIVGGDHHLSSVQYGQLLNEGNTTLHFHDADRARANHTGTQSADTISNQMGFSQLLAFSARHG